MIQWLWYLYSSIFSGFRAKSVRKIHDVVSLCPRCGEGPLMDNLGSSTTLARTKWIFSCERPLTKYLCFLIFFWITLLKYFNSKFNGGLRRTIMSPINSRYLFLNIFQTNSSSWTRRFTVSGGSFLNTVLKFLE